MPKKNDNVNVNESVENTQVEVKPRKKRVAKAPVVQEVGAIDLDSILATKKYKKKALSFYQDKSVADALSTRAEANNKKTSEALSLILSNIIDLDNMTCKINIDEVKEEKIPNTFKVDERILEVLNREANSRNMSLNEYLNKVLKIVFGI